MTAKGPPILRRNPDIIAGGQGAGDKHCELPGGRFLETKSRSRLEGPINLFSKSFNSFLRYSKPSEAFKTIPFSQDDLLPHVTGGFRGRAITVGSLEYDPWMKFVRF